MAMKLQRPVITEEYLRSAEDVQALLLHAIANENGLERVRMRDAFFPGEDLTGLRFQTMILENCRFSGAILQKTSFVDVRFINCDFSNCKMEDTYCNRCEFISCKWVGASLEGATLRQTCFRDSNMQYCNLDHSLFDYVLLQSCDMTSAYLTSCKWKKLELEECRLVQTSFHRTPLKSIDLTTCEISGPVVSESFYELRGAVVRADQAMELSRLLGVVIR